MAHEQLLHELNRLQRRIYESFREFNTTQDNLDSEDLREHFRVQATRRKAQYDQIRAMILNLGEIPKDITHPFGDAADEIFTDIKTFFSSEDDKLILQEVKQKENTLMHAFQQVLHVDNIPDDLKALLESQHNEVRDELELVLERLELLS